MYKGLEGLFGEDDDVLRNLPAVPTESSPAPTESSSAPIGGRDYMPQFNDSVDGLMPSISNSNSTSQAVYNDNRSFPITVNSSGGAEEIADIVEGRISRVIEQETLMLHDANLG